MLERVGYNRCFKGIFMLGTIVGDVQRVPVYEWNNIITGLPTCLGMIVFWTSTLLWQPSWMVVRMTSLMPWSMKSRDYELVPIIGLWLTTTPSSFEMAACLCRALSGEAAASRLPSEEVWRNFLAQRWHLQRRNQRLATADAIFSLLFSGYASVNGQTNSDNHCGN